MKRILLTSLLVIGFAATSIAQIEMYLDGGSTDVSGTVVQISPDGPGTIVSDIHIVNNVGNPGDSVLWTITRVRINEQSTWSDYLCWGHETDPFGGTCYSATQMNYTSWITPNGVWVDAGEGGILQSDITPDENSPATSTYRYLVSKDNGATFDDSIDIEISFSAGINEIKPTLSLNVSPNPASENLTVYSNGVENTSVKMVDVLGNVVLKETILEESKAIDVTKYRNGIYFVIVEAPNARSISRKVIIRH